MTDIQLEETNVVTEDMKLPPGSAVIQCILHRNEDGLGGFLDVRAVTIGSSVLDMSNPAHRFVAAVSERMEEILTQVGEMSELQKIPADDVEARLREAFATTPANETLPAPQPGDLLSLSDGSTIEVADESECPRQVLADACAELGRQEDEQQANLSVQHKHSTAS